MERKTTTTGKPKIDATLTLNGVNTDVTIWGDFPQYNELMPGSTIVGIVTPSKDGKYKPSFNAPRPTTSPKSGAFKQIQIEKTMDKKNESIAHFQGEKEMSIRIASTFRAASEMAVSEYHENRKLSATGPTLEQLFEKWREWLWLRYEVKMNDFPPMK